MQIDINNAKVYLLVLFLFFNVSCTGLIETNTRYSKKNYTSKWYSENSDYSKKKYKGKYKVGLPYKVNGKLYIPEEVTSYKEVGLASWYGKDFHKKMTANGDIFDMNSMTGAHKTLPLPSIVKVTNLENGKTAKLIINDRGPFINDRLIDVSKKAAEVLGFKENGIAKVRVEFVREETEKFLRKNKLK